MKQVIVALVLASLSLLGSAQAGDTQYRDLAWEEMIPAGATQPREFSIEELHNLDQIMAEEEEQAAIVGRQMVTELAGKKVKLPAYVIPLESDGEKTSEFLLVPYFGACIHVPPPPPNQIIFGSYKEGIKNKLFDAVWAYGTILIETVNSDLAESGYSMIVDKVEVLDLETFDFEQFQE